jgi:magnesium transporter
MHLIRLFSMIDKGRREPVGAGEVRDGLTAMWGHFSGFTEEGIGEFVKTLDPQNTGVISQQGFVRGVQDYAARATESGRPVVAEAFCVDYSPDTYSCTHLSQDPAPDAVTFEDFFRRPGGQAEAETRWLHIAGTSLGGVVLQVANRFGITLLQARRALDENEGPRVRTRRDHLHLLVEEVLAVKTTGRRKAGLELVLSDLSIVYVPRLRLVLTIGAQASDMTALLRERVELASSKLRTSNAVFLVYSILDTLIDNNFGVISAFRGRLEELSAALGEHGRIRMNTIKNLGTIAREIGRLEQWCHPMIIVIRRLAPELESVSRGENLQWHLADLIEHIMTQRSLVMGLRRWSRSLDEQFILAQRRRMDMIFYTLTAISSALLPLNTLSGIYGMNFVSFPELEIRYGYLLFWIVSLLLTIWLVRASFKRDLSFSL